MENQDYAQSVVADGIAAVAVADGCSASVHSDVGARFLVHAALQQLTQNNELGLVPKATALGKATIQQAWRALRVLALQPTALDATLCLAWQQGSLTTAITFGDGVVFYRLGDHYHVFEISYSGNAPAYLSYSLDQARCALFDQLNQRKSIRYTLISPAGCRTRTFEQACHQPFVVVPPSAASFLAVASDGMATFHTASGQPLALHETVHHWSSFGSLKGAFLQRRMRSFGKWCHRQRVEHRDDIACGTILMERAKNLLPQTQGAGAQPTNSKAQGIEDGALPNQEVNR